MFPERLVADPKLPLCVAARAGFAQTDVVVARRGRRVFQRHPLEGSSISTAHRSLHHRPARVVQAGDPRARLAGRVDLVREAVGGARGQADLDPVHVGVAAVVLVEVALPCAARRDGAGGVGAGGVLVGDIRPHVVDATAPDVVIIKPAVAGDHRVLPSSAPSDLFPPAVVVGVAPYVEIISVARYHCVAEGFHLARGVGQVTGAGAPVDELVEPFAQEAG